MPTNSNRVLPYPGTNIRRQQIANRLNMLHFRGEPLLVIVRHRVYGYSLTLKAIPQICHGQKLQASWVENDQLPRSLHQFTLVKIIVPGIAMSLEFATENVWLESDRLQADIPEQLQATSGRHVNRHSCSGTVTARLTQNSISFDGTLIDYSPHGMRLSVIISRPQSFYWLNTDQKIILTLTQQDRTLFSGSVKVLRDEGDQDKKTIVVAPTEDQSPRYKPKKKRTKRFATHPSPDISFIHPITGKSNTLSVRDISTLGFSIKESPEQSLLLPGLILNDVNLNLFGSTFLKLTGQVVYRHLLGDVVICGIAILDISIDDHFRLIGLVHRAGDENAFVRINHDPEKFFEFLFDTGFLYPSKYEEVHSQREAFVEAYRKLYLNSNQIARCFVYIENGQIYGHVSALKIYRHAWLNHHHAALPSRRSGLRVLRQISDFHNDSCVLNPLQMRYIVGIWRPSNSFPARFFGGFAKDLNNPKACSVDTFSYLRVTLDTCRGLDDLNGPWELAKATRQDICEFDGFYQKTSGGLLTKAFDLTADSFDDHSVALEYASSGLKRERHLYAVRYGLDLMALVEVQDSDTGLNLSDLTNAVFIYVLDTHMVTPKILEFIQCMVAVKLKREMITIMLYPNTYVKRYQMDEAKEYAVWILNLEYSDDYMQHLSRWCR